MTVTLLLAQAFDDGEQSRNFALGDGGCRLVHDDDVGLRSDRLGDLHDLLLRHAQARDQLPRLDGWLDAVQHADHLVDLVRLPQEPECRIFHPQREVFLDGELVNHIEFLEQGADSFLLRIPGAVRIVLFAIEQNPSARSRIRAGQHLDQGGFPGAVLPNQAVNGIPLDVETDIIDRPDTGEILHKIPDLQHILCRFHASAPWT